MMIPASAACFYYIIFFSAGLALLFSLVHLLVRKRRTENLNLSALLFTVGLLLFQVGFLLNGAAFERPWLLSFHCSLLFLAGPLSYHAYALVVRPDGTTHRIHPATFLPVLAALPADILYFFASSEAKIPLLVRIATGDELRSFYWARLVPLAAGILYAGLLGPLAFGCIRAMVRARPSPLLLVNTLYVVLTLTAASSATAGLALGSPDIARAGAAGIGMLFVCSYIVGIRHPRLIQLLIVEAGRSRPCRGPSLPADVDDILRRTNELMNGRRVYRDDSLSLGSLSAMLEITPHALSWVLNNTLGTNFNSFVNRFRVDEAKRLLDESDSMNVLEISFSVGFNSKSAFNEAFRQFAGTSPRNYRKNSRRAV